MLTFWTSGQSSNTNSSTTQAQVASIIGDGGEPDAQVSWVPVLPWTVLTFYRPVLPLLPLVTGTSMVIVCFRWDEQLSLWNVLTFCRVILPPPVILMEAPWWARMFLHVPMSILRPLQDNPFIRHVCRMLLQRPWPLTQVILMLLHIRVHTRVLPCTHTWGTCLTTLPEILSGDLCCPLASRTRKSSLRSQSSGIAQSPSHAGGDSTNPASLTSSPLSSLETVNAEVPTVVALGLPSPLIQMTMDFSHLAVTPIVHPPLPLAVNPPLIVSPGTPSPPTQMAMNPNHLIISAKDPSSLSSEVPPGVLSPGLPSPVMVANPNHLTVSPVCPPSHNPPVPSITVSPVVSLGGLSSPSSDIQMDVDHDLHVSQLRSGIHLSTTSTDIWMDAGSEFQVPQLRAGNHPGSTAASVVSENLPAPAPSSFPTSPPVTPRPTRPIWPLVLPRVLEDIMSQVVSEQLDVMAASLVKPTVRGIVDTCIPRLTDLIDSCLATESLTPSQSRCATTCKSRASWQPKDSGEGTDGDDEMEEDVFLKTFPRRKKPGPRGKMNHLHVSKQSALQVYLLD